MTEIPDEVRCSSLVGPGGLRCRMPLAHVEPLDHEHGTTKWTRTTQDYADDMRRVDALRRKLNGPYFETLRGRSAA